MCGSVDEFVCGCVGSTSLNLEVGVLAGNLGMNVY